MNISETIDISVVSFLYFILIIEEMNERFVELIGMTDGSYGCRMQ